MIEAKANRFNTAKKEKDVDEIDYSIDVPARYLDTIKNHSVARKMLNERFKAQKQEIRHAATKSHTFQTIKPQSLQMDNIMLSKNTTMLRSKKGNLMRELTVEDVYQDENQAQNRGVKEIMKHI